MRKDWSFLIGKVEFHGIHYLPRDIREPWRLGWLVSKNPSGLFGRGFTTDFYIGQHVFVLVVSRFD
jgi:hypothetical protein